MIRTALATALLAAAIASPALAQPDEDRAPGDHPYGGRGAAAFYDIDRRESALEGRVREMTERGLIGGGQARRALAELGSIRGEAAFRRDRHRGELRDWDRELLTARLNRLADRLPSDPR